MKKAILLILISGTLISHCGEDENLTKPNNVDIESVESQKKIESNLNNPEKDSLTLNINQSRPRKKVATCALYLAFVPLLIGTGIDVDNLHSRELRQVATAFPLNATNAQLQQSSCQHYSCFCDYSTQCVCCSPIFPYFDNGRECRELLHTSDDQYYRQRGVIVKQCTEEVTNNTPIITSFVSIGCRFVTIVLASVTYHCLRK